MSETSHVVHNGEAETIGSMSGVCLPFATFTERPLSDRQTGTVHQGLGDLDAAFDWYAKAFEAHEGVLVFANVDPIFDALRSDPRFAELLQRLHLPGWTPQ